MIQRKIDRALNTIYIIVEREKLIYLPNPIFKWCYDLPQQVVLQLMHEDL